MLLLYESGAGRDSCVKDEGEKVARFGTEPYASSKDSERIDRQR